MEVLKKGYQIIFYEGSKNLKEFNRETMWTWCPIMLHLKRALQISCSVKGVINISFFRYWNLRDILILSLIYCNILYIMRPKQTPIVPD